MSKGYIKIYFIIDKLNNLNIEERTCLFPIDVINDNNEIIEFINEIEVNEIEEDEIVKETVDTVDNIEEKKRKTGIKFNSSKVLRKEVVFKQEVVVR